VLITCSTEPERFIVANEHEALMIMAPQQAGTFDSAVVFRNDDTVARVKDYVTDLYSCSQRVTLHVLQDSAPDPQRGMTSRPSMVSDPVATPLESIVALTRELSESPAGRVRIRASR
jgi:hypothetical protein